MSNPYPYDDGLYTKRSLDLMDAVSAMWEAGASLQNIEDELQAALDNVTNAIVTVTEK